MLVFTCICVCMLFRLFFWRVHSRQTADSFPHVPIDQWSLHVVFLVVPVRSLNSLHEGPDPNESNNWGAVHWQNEAVALMGYVLRWAPRGVGPEVSLPQERSMSLGGRWAPVPHSDSCAAKTIIHYTTQWSGVLPLSKHPYSSKLLMFISLPCYSTLFQI